MKRLAKPCAITFAVRLLTPPTASKLPIREISQLECLMQKLQRHSKLAAPLIVATFYYFFYCYFFRFYYWKKHYLWQKYYTLLQRLFTWSLQTLILLWEWQRLSFHQVPQPPAPPLLLWCTSPDPPHPEKDKEAGNEKEKGGKNWKSNTTHSCLS